MRKLDLPRRRTLPSRWALLVLLGCIMASLFITLNAGAESKAGAPVSAAAADRAPAKPAPARPDVSTPPKAEESATIQDDPTIAPDPKESADNNITFPVDI
ncbi:MAG: hypothetical protein WDO68_13370 [Gammaproteobacteria bacterium]